MASWRETLRRGDPAIWLAGTGLGISILMITGMIVLILANGLGFFRCDRRQGIGDVMN